MAEATLIEFRRSPVLHIDRGYPFGTALCGLTGASARSRGMLRDHLPGRDKPLCRSCQRALQPDWEQMSKEGGLADA